MTSSAMLQSGSSGATTGFEEQFPRKLSRVEIDESHICADNAKAHYPGESACVITIERFNKENTTAHALEAHIRADRSGEVVWAAGAE